MEVKTRGMRSCADTEASVKRGLDQINTSLQKCRTALKSNLSNSASGTIDRAIVTAGNRINNVSGKVSRLSSTLYTISGIYEGTEKDIAGRKPTEDKVAEAKSYNADGSVKSGNSWGVVNVAKSTAKWVVNQEKKAYETISKATNQVYNDAKTICGKIKESYDNHGTFYYVAEYGKVAIKAVGAAAKIAGAIETIVGTGGLATVPALCELVSGMNDVWNLAGDIINIQNKNFDQVGKTNVLRSSLEYVGDKAGGKVGETIGTYAYYGIDVVGNVTALAQSINDLDNLQQVDVSKLGTEAKSMGSAIKAPNAAKISNLKYEYTLATYAFPETGKMIKNVSLIYNVVDKGKDSGESVYKMIHKGEETHVFDGYNNVNDAFGNVKKGTNMMTQLNTIKNNMYKVAK